MEGKVTVEWIFWNASLWSSAKVSNILSFCVGFWHRLWLQKPVETFPCVVRIRSEYVKHSSSRSGKCSARWIMAVRSTKHFLWKEKCLSSGFLKCKSLKLCQSLEYSVILCWFLAQTLTSEARRKFSMCRTHTFWVCKKLYWIKDMWRTLNHDRTTNKTFFWRKSHFRVDFWNSNQLQNILWLCVSFGKDFDFRSP